MEKFVLLTRGRTGSTAVLDELGKTMVLHTTQELFMIGPFPEKVLKNYYKLLSPFDLWKQQGWWWKRLIPVYYGDPRQAHKYLMLAEELAQSQGVKGFGWKVLSHHFGQRPYLAELLKRLGYRVVYLRRNIASQVLSGMVANQRGVYNSLKEIVDDRRYHIDIEKFQWHVRWERDCVKSECARLSAGVFDFVEVSYEDYCDNRDVFYGKIFGLLNLPLELPPPSDFQKMIKDPRMIIENYDEVANVATVLGESL